jgi:hypothetical protein
MPSHGVPLVGQEREERDRHGGTSPPCHDVGSDELVRLIAYRARQDAERSAVRRQPVADRAHHGKRDQTDQNVPASIA